MITVKWGNWDENYFVNNFSEWVNILWKKSKKYKATTVKLNFSVFFFLKKKNIVLNANLQQHLNDMISISENVCNVFCGF